MTVKTQLIDKLQQKSSIIGIIGLGYVGLPLALLYSEVGYKVLGLDIDQSKVEKLKAGESYIAHISETKIQSAVKENFQPSTDFSSASEADALILCVPTPLNKWREPDLSFIVDTLDALLPHLRQGQVISLESTTYPGNTEEVLKPKIEERGFTIGEDFFLVYSPEREDPGNPNFSTAQIPKVCGGIEANSLEVGTALYEQIVREVVPVSSTRAAEMTKLLENIHRAVNIGLVNEMKIVADKMDIDIYEVINAAATKPFGFVPYYPGPGLGGHCIPIDPFYLTWKAREYGIHTRFIELAGEVNSNMPRWVIMKTMDALNERSKPLKGSKILMLGIAYKKNVDDMRESPAIVILESLLEKGAKVDYHDPHIPIYPSIRGHEDLHLNSVELSADNIQTYDCVMITTAHKKVDYELIKQHAKLIIDTRGIYQERAEHIVKA